MRSALKKPGIITNVVSPKAMLDIWTLPAATRRDVARLPDHDEWLAKTIKPGGVVLLAINPGGGGDAYSCRTPEDQRLYPLLRAFKSAAPEDAFPIFERINDELARVINSWNLRKIVMPTIEAAGVRFSEICYLNAVPYRTREDRLPSVAAKKSAWSLVVAPTLRLIQPKAVIALGMKAGDALSRNHSGAERAYVVPRSIGDSRITPEAQTVLAQIRQEFDMETAR